MQFPVIKISHGGTDAEAWLTHGLPESVPVSNVSSLVSAPED
jgi:hypothetical protein